MSNVCSVVATVVVVVVVAVAVVVVVVIAADVRAQELCESRGGRPGLPVPDSPYGLCGRKATLNLNAALQRCLGDFH